jgi:hypothetical protein
MSTKLRNKKNRNKKNRTKKNRTKKKYRKGGTKGILKKEVPDIKNDTVHGNQKNVKFHEETKKIDNGVIDPSVQLVVKPSELYGNKFINYFKLFNIPSINVDERLASIKNGQKYTGKIKRPIYSKTISMKLSNP